MGMRQLKLSLLIGSTTLLMIGFQNCAKYQYAQVDNLADGSNAGLNTDNIPDGAVIPIDQTGNNGELGGSDGATDPVVGGGNPPPSDEGPSDPIAGGGNPPPSDEGPGNGGQNPPAQNGGQDPVADCQMEKLNGSANNDNIADATNGKIIITPENIGSLSEIDNFHGKIVLCGVSLEMISNTGGNITLVDSTVEQIVAHNGGIHVKGANAGANITGSEGYVEVDRKEVKLDSPAQASNGKSNGKGKN